MVNHSRRILEILSAQPEPLKNCYIFHDCPTSHSHYCIMIRSLVELGLVDKPRHGYYEITEIGQKVLNQLRGSKY
jgi:predicted transcriptional regulator